MCSGYFLSSCCMQTRDLILSASVSSWVLFFLKHWSSLSGPCERFNITSLLATLRAVSKLIGIFQIGNLCFWVPFFKQLLLRKCAVDFVEICNVCARKVIIKVAKRMVNSDNIWRSYCDFYFGVTFLEHSVHALWRVRRRCVSSHSSNVSSTCYILIYHIPNQMPSIDSQLNFILFFITTQQLQYSGTVTRFHENHSTTFCIIVISNKLIDIGQNTISLAEVIRKIFSRNNWYIKSIPVSLNPVHRWHLS